MDIVTSKINEIVIVKISGRLDTNTAVDFENKLEEVSSSNSPNIVIDFADLEYICSSGLRVLIQAAKKLKQVDGKLVLCSMQDYIQEVFEISGFDTFLPIVSTIDNAMEQF